MSYSSCPHNVINAFYHADLLEISERPSMTIHALWLIDDVNILAYGTSTERNIRAVERLHKQCENQTRRYSSTFASTKYELIRLARNPERFNVAAEISITEEAKAPEPVDRVLGIQIDTKEMGPIYRIRRNWSHKCGRSQISHHPLEQVICSSKACTFCGRAPRHRLWINSVASHVRHQRRRGNHNGKNGPHTRENPVGGSWGIRLHWYKYCMQKP